jgi:hypothetical protein
MSTSKKLRVFAIAAVAAGFASFAGSTSAMADQQIKLAGFTWLDETVYRPDCPSNERDRGWSSGGPCYDKNCR